jgi:hypothetical protein
MTNSNGDPTNPGGDSAGRRPTAIIDVKATTVESDAPGRDEAADADRRVAEPTGAGESASSTVEQPAPADAAAADRGQHSGGGLSALITHSAAGMAGGILTVAAALVLGQLLGLGQGDDFAAQDIERRIRAIETSPIARAPQELQQKLMAAEQRLARLEEAGRNAAPAGEAQARLATQVKGIEDKLAKSGGDAAQARLAKLEERIDKLSSTPSAADGEQLNREIADLKSATARLTQRIESLQTENANLKGDLARELKSVARSQDVSKSLAPVSGKLSALEQELETLAKSDLDRKANTERIILALELGNLKRVIERGVPYTSELAEVGRASGGKLDLAVLERYKSQGVPPVAELARDFRGLTHAIIAADTEQPDASIFDRLLASAKSIVRVRRVSHSSGDTGVEAVVARMEAGVKDGNPAAVLEAAKQLSPKAKEPARAWLEKVEARAAVDRAISDIDAELKASLGPGKAQKG